MLTSLIVLCPWIPVLLKFSPISHLDFMHDHQGSGIDIYDSV